jgi:hypothetical protein
VLDFSSKEVIIFGVCPFRMLHAPTMNVRMPRMSRRYGFHSNSSGRLVMSHELERINPNPPSSILASGLAFKVFVNAKINDS